MDLNVYSAAIPIRERRECLTHGSSNTTREGGSLYERISLSESGVPQRPLSWDQLQTDLFHLCLALGFRRWIGLCPMGRFFNASTLSLNAATVITATANWL